MNRKTLLVLSAALALSTFAGHRASAQNPVPPQTNILAEESGREAALDPTLYQRPTGQTIHTVWYKGSRMNHWEVYTTTPNVRIAENIVRMLQDLGYSSHFSTTYY